MLTFFDIYINIFAYLHAGMVKDMHMDMFIIIHVVNEPKVGCHFVSELEIS